MNVTSRPTGQWFATSDPPGLSHVHLKNQRLPKYNLTSPYHLTIMMLVKFMCLSSIKENMFALSAILITLKADKILLFSHQITPPKTMLPGMEKTCRVFGVLEHIDNTVHGVDVLPRMEEEM